MTIVPNLLATGVLAILASLVFLIWATMHIQRRNGGPILILLSALMLLVGGGFGPPILGMTLGLAATGINSPLTWWRTRLPTGPRRLLANLWPWCFVAGVTAWLLLMPGTIIFDSLFGMDDPDFVVPLLTFSALGLLLLTIFAGFAHDAQRHGDLLESSSVSW